NPRIQDPGRIRTLSAAMAKGEIMAEMLVQRYLDRIAAFDGQVRAWVHLLADAALAEARALDAERKASIIRDPLHGIPVGIKEVIDVRRTTDM
ncbi:MAG: amidase family protein, partial [bacterium]